MTARSYTYTVSDVASAAHVDFVEPEYTVRSRSTRRRLGEKKHVYKAISKGIGRTVVVSDDTRHIIELEIYYFITLIETGVGAIIIQGRLRVRQA